MTRWLVMNSTYYAAALGGSYLLVRRMPTVLRVVMAAWVVVAAKYVLFPYGIARQIICGSSRPQMLLSWAVLSPLVTLFIVPIAVIFSYHERHDLATLGLVVAAANWILFEVFEVHLAILGFPVWTWAFPLLSVTTLVVLGQVALRNGVGRRRTRG